MVWTRLTVVCLCHHTKGTHFTSPCWLVSPGRSCLWAAVHLEVGGGCHFQAMEALREGQVHVTGWTGGREAGREHPLSVHEGSVPERGSRAKREINILVRGWPALGG